MIAIDSDLDLLADWSDYISDPATRSAFQYMVGLSVCLREFHCQVQWKGEIRDFRLLDALGQQPFSFITNQKWLLFYFRAPAVRSGTYKRDEVESLFDSLKENPAGEWTIKIRSIDDVEKLCDYLGWTTH